MYAQFFAPYCAILREKRAALEKKDYEAMMKAQQGGGRPGPAYAGSRGGD